jgi:hypothetical protein
VHAACGEAAAAALALQGRALAEAELQRLALAGAPTEQHP